MSDDRILDAEEVADLYREVCDAAAAGDPSLAGEVLDALIAHDAALREQLRTAETERDAAREALGVIEIVEAERDAAEARVEALTQALAVVRALIVPMDNAPDTVDPILAKVIVEQIDGAVLASSGTETGDG